MRGEESGCPGSMWGDMWVCLRRECRKQWCQRHTVEAPNSGLAWTGGGVDRLSPRGSCCEETVVWRSWWLPGAVEWHLRSGVDG